MHACVGAICVHFFSHCCASKRRGRDWNASRKRALKLPLHSSSNYSTATTKRQVNSPLHSSSSFRLPFLVLAIAKTIHPATSRRSRDMIPRQATRVLPLLPSSSDRAKQTLQEATTSSCSKTPLFQLFFLLRKPQVSHRGAMELKAESRWGREGKSRDSFWRTQN